MAELLLGAGEIGRRLAARLVGEGRDVTIVSRSGTPVEGARAVALDVTDAAALRSLAQSAGTVFLTTSPSQYHRWPELWPPIIDSVLGASRGANLVLMGNLYAYGRADMPMTEHSAMAPVEAKGAVRQLVWERALAAHQRGEVQVVEVRAADYFGPGVGRTSVLGDRFFAPLLGGKVARVVADPAAPHSWSYLPDVVDTLATAARYRGEWGRAWHVPSDGPHSFEEIVTTVNEHLGSTGRVDRYSGVTWDLLSSAVPFLRAVRESSYQFTEPFVIDATETERELGVAATDWRTALLATAMSYQATPAGSRSSG
jgi:nucleoside-diphosphate-sugar epimerase